MAGDQGMSPREVVSRLAAPGLGRRARWSAVRRRRLAAGAVVGTLALAGALAGFVQGGGSPNPKGGSGTVVPSSRLTGGRAPAEPSVRTTLGDVTFPGRLALPLPKTGEGAVYVPGLGFVGSTPNERPVPMASVTKVMTAYIILRDHPLSGSEGGPVFTMTKQDNLDYITASENDESNVFVKAGERIDERQLLEALLLPSADNAADYLARWDAGSLVAFATKMNAEARALGLTGTHYADASGFNPRSVSTARDQAVVAALAMENPVFRSIVDNTSLPLPTGRVWNYNPAVGVDGIVGVKSGFIQASQACLVTAAWRTVAGHRFLVVSSVLDQPLGLGYAAQVDEALTVSASAALVSRTVLAAGSVVGRAVARSGASSPVSVSGGAVSVVGWPGLVLHPAVVPVPARASRLPAGATVALLELGRPGEAPATAVPLVLDRPLAAGRSR